MVNNSKGREAVNLYSPYQFKPVKSINQKLMKAALLAVLLFAFVGKGSIYDFKVPGLDGKEINFKKFKGKKLMIVNTASKCGNTPQYAQLEELYEKYKDKLVIVGFPANNFGSQEPGTNTEINEFCKKNYG